MAVKQKKIYSLNNFRGLDKENKLLKVAPFRAADGENFIIDSETLKTRPAFKFIDEIPFSVEDGDLLVDWYEFREVKVYITKKHIYIYDGINVINEQHLNFIATGLTSFDFEGSSPLFREEKECLFIFNVGYIYVFSILRDVDSEIYKYVMYEMSGKPFNPFATNDYYYTQYDELPIPYEPTLLIGDDRFDDINLLSKVTKYSLFASVKKEEDGRTTYKLATAYDIEKHGNYGVEMSFYKDKFEEFGIYPIFLGKEDENFEGLATQFGASLNNGSPIVIEDTFFPLQPFEYIGLPTDPTPTIVAEVLGLDKDWFFKSRVEDGNKQVFEYILDYIKLDQSLAIPLIDDNKVLEFELPIEYKATFRDATNNYIVGTVVKQSTIIIFVQLRLFEVDQTFFEDQVTFESEKILEYNLANPYPTMPTPPGTFTELTLSDAPIRVSGLNIEEFISIVNTYLKQNEGLFSQDELLKVSAYIYDGSSDVQEEVITPEANHENWIFRRKSIFTNIQESASEKIKEYTLTNDHPAYPYYAGVFTEIQLTATPTQIINFVAQDFIDLYNAYLLANGDDFVDGESVRFKAQFKDYYDEETFEDITPEAWANWLFKTLPNLNQESIDLSAKEEVTDLGLPYPDYPYVPSIGYTVITLPGNPHFIEGYTQSDFIQDCIDYVDANPDAFTDGHLVKFKGQYYELGTVVRQESIVAESNANWIFKEENRLTLIVTYQGTQVTEFDLGDPYPAYPSVSEVGRTVIDLGTKQVSTLGVSITEADAKVSFLDHINDYVDEELMLYKQRQYEAHTEVHNIFANMEASYNWEVTEQVPVDRGDYYSGTPMPTPINPNGYPVVQPPGPVVILTSGDPIVASEHSSAIQGYCTEYASIYASGQGTAIMAIQIHTYFGLEFYEEGVWVFVQFDYDDGVDIPYEIRRSYIVTAEANKGIDDSEEITINVPSTFPDYPTFVNSEPLEVITLNIVFTGTTEYIDYTSQVVYDAIEQQISDNLDMLTGDIGEAFAKVMLQTSWNGGTDKRGVSLVVKFAFEKYSENASEIRQSMIYLGNINRYIEEDTSIIIDDENTFPDYPLNFNPGALEVLDLGIVYTGTTDTFDYANATLLQNIEDEISALLSTLTGDSGNAIAKVRIQTSWNGGVDKKGVSLVLDFTYQKYVNTPYEFRQSFVMITDISRIIEEKDDIVLDDANTFPIYPTFDNSGGLDVIDLEIVFTGTNQFFEYDNATLMNAIVSGILDELAGLTGDFGNGFAKVKIQNSYNDGGTIINKGVSLVLGFYYQKYISTPYENRQSVVLTCIVNKNQQMAEEGVYEFSFNEKDNTFDLKVRDYFFDYNNEPSIEVKVTFQNNPDYKYISHTLFGATFGSENRLFLAGHPDFPNIDRYNVSNDLLGNNVKNQSYELSFFPSKNYRVLGGKGAINGYVVATDSHLYITKKEYPNDEKLFIRNRVMDDNGIVGYNEYKTSVSKSPLNSKCIVRFNNDILMLTKDGLYAIEISSNVLTDERLIKLRSGFINKDIIKEIENYDIDKIFIIENNHYMYIFIGKVVYVADSRYIEVNENSEINNYNYEIVKWLTNNVYTKGKIEGKELVVVEESGEGLYQLKEDFDDEDYVVRHNDLLSIYNVPTLGKNSFIIPSSFDYMLEDPTKYTFTLKDGYKVLGNQGVDYHVVEDDVIIDNFIAFRNIEDGDKIYFKENVSGNFIEFTVSDFEDGVSIQINDQLDLDLDIIYQSVVDKDLRISIVFEVEGDKFFRLTPYIPSEVLDVKIEVGESDEDYLTRLDGLLLDNDDYFFTNEGLQDVYINIPSELLVRWVSAITDLGNRTMEKTMFRTNIYATKKSTDNFISFGYKTMRRLDIRSRKVTSVANPMDLGQIDFNNFALSTFSEFGTSIPTKESNFLYIQFIIEGRGQIELNSLDIIYKLNRLIKTIG